MHASSNLAAAAMSATGMLSFSVCTSRMPVLICTIRTPLVFKTLASEPPPVALGRGSSPSERMAAVTN